MNTIRLNTLIQNSGLNKSQFADRCGISRTTLDNILSGADGKISTAESIANVLGIRVGYLFDESAKAEDEMLEEIQRYQRQIAELKKERRTAAKICVEIELEPDELEATGIREKVIAKLKGRSI